MACSSRPPKLQPAAPPSRPRPWQLPPPSHQDTSPTLTLSLALPASPLVGALTPRTPHLRRPRQDGGGASAFVRVRSSLTGDPPPCTECGKPFPSWKALFGHMRCHPERQWRGITPPPPHFRHGELASAPLAVAAADQFTVQEREVAAGLLMLAGAGKGKKSIVATFSAKESGGTSTSSPTPPAPPPRCGAGGEHKCSVCDRGFATGQALGRHKCHWERACAEVKVVATPASTCSASPASEAPATTLLDLNLPPPGTMLLPWKSDDQGGSLNALLDLKLGY